MECLAFGQLGTCGDLPSQIGGCLLCGVLPFMWPILVAALTMEDGVLKQDIIQCAKTTAGGRVQGGGADPV